MRISEAFIEIHGDRRVTQGEAMSKTHGKASELRFKKYLAGLRDWDLNDKSPAVSATASNVRHAIMAYAGGMIAPRKLKRWANCNVFLRKRPVSPNASWFMRLVERLRSIVFGK